MNRLVPSITHTSPSRRAVAAQRGGVGARPGLGERVGGEHLPRSEPRQPRRALLRRPRELQPERAELLDGEDQPGRRADLRDLLDRDEGEQRSRAEPAVGLVEEQSEDAVLAVELDDVPGERVRGVDLGGARRDALARQRADQLAQLTLLVGQGVPGHRSPPLCRIGLHHDSRNSELLQCVTSPPDRQPGWVSSPFFVDTHSHVVPSERRRRARRWRRRSTLCASAAASGTRVLFATPHVHAPGTATRGATGVPPVFAESFPLVREGAACSRAGAAPRVRAVPLGGADR